MNEDGYLECKGSKHTKTATKTEMGYQSFCKVSDVQMDDRNWVLLWRKTCFDTINFSVFISSQMTREGINVSLKSTRMNICNASCWNGKVLFNNMSINAILPKFVVRAKFESKGHQSASKPLYLAFIESEMIIWNLLDCNRWNSHQISSFHCLIEVEEEISFNLYCSPRVLI